jgi:hypothetical protein
MSEDNNREQDGSVVRDGGIASEPADVEDVTRDTYGFTQPEPNALTHEERVAEADRAASALGIPGAEVPDQTEAEESSGE